MLTRKQKSEINRRSNKLSYKGKHLDRRIKNQMCLVDSFKKCERNAKGAWFSAQLNVMIAEDELESLCAIRLKSQRVRV